MSAGSTPILHELRKFSDLGLQLRTPVDLVPPSQFSRLTNALPLIEGEIRTRDGLTLIEDLFKDAAVASLDRVSLVATLATIANTIYPHGYIVGEAVTIVVYANSPTALSTIVLGTYVVTVVTVPTTTSFTFTPGIPAIAWDAAETSAPVFAQATGSGQITTLPITAITNLFRLNQELTNIAGDRLAAMAGRLFKAPLPDGDTFYELVLPSAPNEPPSETNGFSGRPLSIISFRFTNDEPAWAIIADQSRMAKFREDAGGVIYFFRLGNPTPLFEATASAGGAGNLNSTGGADYDWRYTYFDGIVETEGNPSPEMTAGTMDTKNPTSFTKPDPDLAGSGFTAATATTGTGTGAAFTSVTVIPNGGQPPTLIYTSNINWQSCRWFGFASPASVPATMMLIVDYSTAASSSGGAVAQAQVQYSFNNGAAWATLFSVTTTTGRTLATVLIPAGTDYTQMIVRSKVGGVSASTTGSSSATMTLNIFDIRADANLNPTAAGLALVNQSANVCCADPGTLNDGRVTAIRLYRRGGSLPDAWRLVGTFTLTSLTQGACSAGYLEINDNVSDTTLSTSPILELDNDPPVTSVSTDNQPLNFIWGPVGLDARVLGCGDPNRPESVYFSKPGNPDAWPPQNHVEVSEPGTPILAGCVFNTRTFAFSSERIYELVEGYIPGITYTPFVTPSAHGIISPWAFAVGTAIYFVSKDGIYETTGGQESSIVENDIKPLFPTYDSPGRTVNGYEAVDMTQTDAMRLRWHNSEVYFEYLGQTSGTRQLLVYDTLKHRWRSAVYTTGISEVYSEPGTTSSLLLGTNAGAIYQAGGDTDPSELDVIENAVFTSVSNLGTTLTPGSYYCRLSRFSSVGEVALSDETSGVTVDATHAISTSIPPAPQDTVKWRVYYGLTLGVENQYQEYSEASLTLGRDKIIDTAGTAGSPPVVTPVVDIQVLLRTGAHDQGQPLNRKQYDNVIFDLDPGGSDIVITPYINGEEQAQASITVTGAGRQQVPLDLSDFFAFNVEYQIAWTQLIIADITPRTEPILFQYDTLFMLEPVGVKHVKMQPTAFGFPGYVHMRDGYIAIRSNADVTLTLLIDGVTTQTYTVPSTSGERQKVYVQFASNKGKQYQLSFDSEEEFRTYDSDMEFRVKPWLGLLGYSVQRPFPEAVGAGAE
jgi:hypothetical protein